MQLKRYLLISLVALFTQAVLISQVTYADEMCGETGTWIQILGSGGPELDDRQASASYLIWHNNKARVLIDAGPGASVAFDKSEANFEDLQAIAFTHLHVDHTADFPAFIKGSHFLQRTEPLIVLGPDSNNPNYPSTEEFVNRLIGPNGAYAYLKDFLTHKSSGGYRVRPRNVPSLGKRPWAQFSKPNLKMSAIPVNHGPVPALAWKVEIDDQVMVFTGDFNNLKNVIPKFAKDADALVATHAIPEIARGAARELHALPSQLGRVAKQANARMLILGHRMNRTRGRESQSRGHIEAEFEGYLLFANDQECWGL